nr:helix-turn-helix domain-containing protein [Enterococcus innesii]
MLENIFMGELKSIDEWTDCLFLSKSTLSKYLRRIHQQLTHFDLTLTLDPVNIVGEEADIRNFFCTFFYETDITPHTVFPSVAVQQAVTEISGMFEKIAIIPPHFLNTVICCIFRSSDFYKGKGFR